MMRSSVEEVIVEALREVQALGGHDWTGVPPPDAPVIGSVEGFDSLTGIEATVLVETKLSNKIGRDIKLGLDSVFVSPDGRKALNLGDIVTTVCSAIGGA